MKCVALSLVRYLKLHHGLSLTSHTFPYFISQLPWNCCMALKCMKFENWSHDLLENFSVEPAASIVLKNVDATLPKHSVSLARRLYS
jgi:hypothetical protein